MPVTLPISLVAYGGNYRRPTFPYTEERGKKKESASRPLVAGRTPLKAKGQETHPNG